MCSVEERAIDLLELKNEYYLLSRDVPVLYFNFEDMEVRVLEETLLPYALRNRIKVARSYMNAVQTAKVLASNIKTVEDYLSSRVISLSRTNAKLICQLYNLQQSQSQKNRVEICLMCRGVSVQDSYWIKSLHEDITWSSVNIRQNHFADIVSIALDGENVTLTTSDAKPDLTTKGMFRKAWIRRAGDLYLLKSDESLNQINTRMEVLASAILDTSVYFSYVKYTGEIRQGKYVSVCKSYASEDYNFVEAREVYEFIRTFSDDMETLFVPTNFAEGLANIAVVDYILANTDRHDENFGYITDSELTKVVSVAPVYDYNMCLVSDVLGNDVSDCLSQMIPHKRYTIEELCLKYLSKATVRFNTNAFNKLYDVYSEYSNVLNRVKDRISKLGLWL